MNNNSRVWTVGTVCFAVVMGIAVNFLYDFLKTVPAGGADTPAHPAEARGAAPAPLSASGVPAPAPPPVTTGKPDRSGHKTLQPKSFTAPEGDD